MNSNRLIATIVVLVLVLGGIGWYLSSKGMLPGSRSANGSDWQAVFLDNGQVYFGKLGSESKDYAVLNNIYYLQVAQSGTDQKAATDQQAQVSLVKLGNELHGPVDSMRINRQHILFIEKMKNDSKVVDAISRYVANPSAAQQAPALTVSPSPSK